MNLSRLSLNLRFDKTSLLDPLLTFSRASGATRINKTTGLIELVAPDMPRLERDGLLIEDASTNYLTAEARFTSVGGSYEKGKPDPAGSMAAIRFDANNYIAVWDCDSLPAGPQSASIWMRAVEDTCNVRLAVACGDAIAAFEGVTLTTTWTRFSVTAPNAWVSNYSRLLIDSISGAFETYGPQLESSPFSTSYIPTTDTPATRAEELCAIYNIAGQPWLNPSNYTIILDAFFQKPTDGVDSTHLQILKEWGLWGGDGNPETDNRFSGIGMRGTTYGIFLEGPVFNWANIPHTVATRRRIAIARNARAATTTIAADGQIISTSASVPMGPRNYLSIGSAGGYGSQPNAHIRALTILPHDVSDAVLVAMSEQ